MPHSYTTTTTTKTTMNRSQLFCINIFECVSNSRGGSDAAAVAAVVVVIRSLVRVLSSKTGCCCQPTRKKLFSPQALISVHSMCVCIVVVSLFASPLLYLSLVRSVVVVAPKNKSEGPNQARPMFNRLSKSLVNQFPQRRETTRQQERTIERERTRESYVVLLCSALSCAVIKDLWGLIEPSTLTNRWAINLTPSHSERERETEGRQTGDDNDN